VIALGGCGGVGGQAAGDSDLTLLLDGRPSGLDAGIFLAADRGFDEAEGIELDIRGTGDPRRLLRRDRVQAVVLRRDAVAGSGAVCVMALIQAPQPDRFVCVSPTTLENQRANVEALVRALQRGYTETGVDPESAVQAVVTARAGLDAAEVTAQLDAAAGDFIAGVPAFGFLRREAMPPGDFAYGLVGPVSRD
jgi:ABC-type nitrate/sulfonate/bicarbonate transport system substrate-binding protein